MKLTGHKTDSVSRRTDRHRLDDDLAEAAQRLDTVAGHLIRRGFSEPVLTGFGEKKTKPILSCRSVHTDGAPTTCGCSEPADQRPRTLRMRATQRALLARLRDSGGRQNRFGHVDRPEPRRSLCSTFS